MRADPDVSIVLSTRNRSTLARNAVESILASACAEAELIVVDQSTFPDKAGILSDFRGDRRFRLIRDAGFGLSRARNIGCDQSRAPFVLFTDDDCEICRGWDSALAAALRCDPQCGVVFGTVKAPSYDRTAGLIPAYEAQPRTVRTIRHKSRIEGIGASMGIRKQVWRELGGFDEHLGAGAPLCAGEDTDFLVRALIAGYAASETGDAVVIHNGLRTWDEGDNLVRGYMLGLGAVNAKMLRMGGLAALQPLVELGWRWLTARPVVDLNYVPPRALRLAAFVRGFRAGLSLPLEGPRLQSPALQKQEEESPEAVNRR